MKQYIRLLIVAALLLVGCGGELSSVPSAPAPPTAPMTRSSDLLLPVSGPVTSKAAESIAYSRASDVTNVPVSLNTGWNAVGFQAQKIDTLSPNAAIPGLAFYDGTDYQIRNFTAADINSSGGGRRGFFLYAFAPTSFTYSGTDTGENYLDLSSATTW